MQPGGPNMGVSRTSGGLGSAGERQEGWGYPKQAEICRTTSLMRQENGKDGGTASGGHVLEFTGCRMFWNGLCRMFFTILGCHRSWRGRAQISTWPHASNSIHLPEVHFLCLCLSCRMSARARLEQVDTEPSTVPGTQEALRHKQGLDSGTPTCSWGNKRDT